MNASRSASNPPLVEVDGLHVAYGQEPSPVRAVQDASLAVQPGECVGIVGESGSGKSTLLRALIRLLPPPGRVQSGVIRVGGTDISRMDVRQLREFRSRRVGMVFQDPTNSWNPLSPIRQQMRRAFRVGGHVESRREVDRSIDEALERVGLDLAGKSGAYPFEFSQGQLQRIMIATACFAGRPELLLADEPTASLDVTIEAQVIRTLRSVTRDLGMTVLLVTHNLGVVSQLCDRALVMYGGRIVESNSVERLLKAPLHPYTQSLLRGSMGILEGDRRVSAPARGRSTSPHSGCVFAPRCPEHLGSECDEILPAWSSTEGGGVACHLSSEGADLPLHRGATTEGDPEGQHSVRVARPDGDPEPSAEREPVGPVLSVKGVRVHYRLRSSLRGKLRGLQPRVHAVDGVSLDVRPGEIIGLIGESGSGKSTLARTLVGLESPTAGQVLYQGSELGSLAAGRALAVRRRLQLIFQNPYSAVNRRKRVLDIVREPLDVHKLGDQQQRRRRAEVALREVGLDESFDGRYPSQLSGGQVQRVTIARALALDPELLVADEPTAALDVSLRSEIIGLLSDLRRRRSLSMVIVSHDLAVVGAVSDRIAVMYLGRVVESGPADSVMKRPLHPYTQALLAAVPRFESGQQDDDLPVLGEIPSPIDRPTGCHYRGRCPLAMDQCAVYPALEQHDEGHFVACHAVVDLPPAAGHPG